MLLNRTPICQTLNIQIDLSIWVHSSQQSLIVSFQSLLPASWWCGDCQLLHYIFGTCLIIPICPLWKIMCVYSNQMSTRNREVQSFEDISSHSGTNVLRTENHSICKSSMKWTNEKQKWHKLDIIDWSRYPIDHWLLNSLLKCKLIATLIPKS